MTGGYTYHYANRSGGNPELGLLSVLSGDLGRHRYKGTWLMIVLESWQAISGSGVVASAEMAILEEICSQLGPAHFKATGVTRK